MFVSCQLVCWSGFGGPVRHNRHKVKCTSQSQGNLFQMQKPSVNRVIVERVFRSYCTLYPVPNYRNDCTYAIYSIFRLFNLLERCVMTDAFTVVSRGILLQLFVWHYWQGAKSTPIPEQFMLQSVRMGLDVMEGNRSLNLELSALASLQP